MRALWSVVVIAVLSGCPFNGIPCADSNQCGDGNSCVDGFCVKGDGGTGGGTTTGGGGGATGGGGGATGGGGGMPADAGQCVHSPPCDDATTFCVDTTTAPGYECRLRWTGIEILAPTAGADFNIATASAVEVRARLIPAAGADGGGVAPPMLGGTTTLLPNAGGYVGTTMLTGTGSRTISVTRMFGTQDLQASVMVNVDGEAPILSVFVPPPNYGATTGDFIPSLNAGEYRKDEVVTIEVRSASADVNPASLNVSASMSGPVLTLSNPSPCSTATFCRAYALDLSKVDLAGFSGETLVTATGTDLAGNQAQSGSATAKVTRWQWARKVGSNVTGALAIGQGGRVFVPVFAGAQTGVVAVDALGAVAWGPTNDGPIVGAIAVGREGTTAGSNEWAFAQPTTNSGAIRSYAAANGVAGNSCGGAGSTVNEGGLALLGEGSTTVGGVGLQSVSTSPSRLAVNRVVSSNCHTDAAGGVSRVLTPGNLVATSSVTALVGSNGNLRVFDNQATQFVARSINQSVGGVGVVNGLVWLSGSRIAGGGGPGIGKLFAFDIATTTATSAWASPTPYSTPLSGPSVRGNGELVAAMRTANDKVKLVRVGGSDGVEVALSSELTDSSSTSGALPTPLLGQDLRTYFVDENGRLFVLPSAFSSGSSESWAAALAPAVGAHVSAPATLDCNRRSATSSNGVLYFATTDGWLVSYIVDAKGLDTNAVWPKYARDARNSGNFDGPPLACP